MCVINKVHCFTVKWLCLIWFSKYSPSVPYTAYPDTEVVFVLFTQQPLIRILELALLFSNNIERSVLNTKIATKPWLKKQNVYLSLSRVKLSSWWQYQECREEEKMMRPKTRRKELKSKHCVSFIIKARRRKTRDAK